MAIDININTGSDKSMDRKMDVIVNLPDPNNVTLPSIPFVVANGMQEALIVGSRIDNNVPTFVLTHLTTGEVIIMTDTEFKIMYANKQYTLAQCNIVVNI